ncbi:hypothetical protein [Dyadobacter sp. 22481]|uniref:hypothetical protein n=1 Tax=Dyadobacter sp. 22481 TaxID=3453926 RepID=UPI003F85BB4B
MLRLYAKLTVLAVGLFSFSCSLQDHVIPATPDVYVTGYSHTNADKIARYWKNGEAVDLLSNINGAAATSIAASGGDVYVVGWDADNSSSSRAKYWKNGVLQTLSGPYTATVLSKVLLSGSDVYVAGSGANQSGYYAMYWKNGAPVVLNDSRDGWARDMAIDNGDIYVTGNASGGPGELAVAKYWKNGASVQLTSGPEQQYPNGIAVSGSDVHVVGTQNGDGTHGTIAKYWKNGVETILSPASYHSNANDIAVVGSDVYIVGNVAGKDNYYTAKIWKNGIASTLPGGVEASGITIVGSDIYVSGTGLNGLTNVAKYWKNGVPVDLTNGMLNNITTSIFVVNP